MSVSKIKMLLPLVVALMLLTSQPVVSQRIVEQPCPDPESRPIVQNFDLDRVRISELQKKQLWCGLDDSRNFLFVSFTLSC